jgi:hypothetical protein
VIVEDGTGKSDADAYCTLAFANAWHLSRGITLWATMSDAEKEAAIVRATHFMTQRYRLRWLGTRRFDTQALDWPRYNVQLPDVDILYVQSTVVPVEVQQACAEMAFKAAAGDLTPDEGQRVKRQKVDVVEVEYADGSRPTKRYVAVDRLLAPYLFGANGDSTMRVLRA